MNLFDLLTRYAGKWNVSDSRPFSDEEKQCIERNEIVKSQYGNSVCFYLRDGGMCFIPCASDMKKGVGESIDLEKAKILTLSKKGEPDIMRVSE